MADNDWDEDNFEVPVKFVAPVVPSKWDGEDEDVEVKDSWEDFDDEEKEKESDTKVEAQPVKVKKKKLLEKAIAEKESKKKKDLEDKVEPQVTLTPEELIAEKLRRQRLQEESDLQLAKEAFGIDSGSNDLKNRLESMCPSTKDDFDAYRKALVETVSKNEKSTFYVSFLEDYFRDLCIGLEAEEVKKIGNALQSLANEKAKATRAAANKGKKKGKAKASLVLGKADDYDYGGEYEQNEFDDFM